jgi:hypothetical protein
MVHMVVIHKTGEHGYCVVGLFQAQRDALELQGAIQRGEYQHLLAFARRLDADEVCYTIEKPVWAESVI